MRGAGTPRQPLRMAFLANGESTGGSCRAFPGSGPEQGWIPFLRLRWPLGIVRAEESTWISFSQSRRPITRASQGHRERGAVSLEGQGKEKSGGEKSMTRHSRANWVTGLGCGGKESRDDRRQGSNHKDILPSTPGLPALTSFSHLPTNN